MKYLDSFSALCPDGFRPIVQPPEWKPKEILGVFEYPDIIIPISEPFMQFDQLIQQIECGIRSLGSIQSATKVALARRMPNEFRIGIDKDGQSIISDFFNEFQSQTLVNAEIHIPTSCVWIFQRYSLRS